MYSHRFGLLYRAGGLLLAKISSDGLFIVYVNSSPETDTLWAYPFGISCILLVSAGNRLHPLSCQQLKFN